MDYEKAYKEALEKAKKLYGKYCINNVLESLFPELAENDDERIRGAIIDHLKDNNLTEWAAWLEKQGQSTFDKCRQEGDRIVENPDGTHFNISQLERVAKIEPKFKVGDWITNGYCKCQITFIDSRYWYSETCVLGDVASIDKKYHLWTIQDAKDGDVLMSRTPFIYGKQYPYGGLNWYNNKFIKASNFIFIDSPVHPATKEQRDLLFQKMKEAGYEWDEEKKELRKIEKQGEQKWSDEDERMMNFCISRIKDELESLKNNKFAHQEILQDCKEGCWERIDWLKSIKKRMEE